MDYNPSTHHRRSIRLTGYDYSQPGAYFITLCTRDRECLFGEIVIKDMQLNEFGEIVCDEWQKTAALRANVELGEWVVMPNHFHAIVWIVDLGRGTARRAPTTEQFGKPVAGSIPTIVRAFKSAVTKRINIARGTPGAPVWQRDYWEHVIRDQKSYVQIVEYILHNPVTWREDQLWRD